MRSRDADQLRRLLSESLGLAAESLMRAAMIVRALEEKGEDLSDLRIGLLGYLRQIAYGQVRPAVVVRYAEYPSLLRRVAALPLPDQDSLAEGNPLTMVVRRDDGSFDRRMVDPLKLPFADVKRVIGLGRIHDESDQILLMEADRERPKKRKHLPSGAVRPDRNRNGVVVGRTFIPLADVLAATSALSDAGEDVVDTAEMTATVVVRLTEAEHVNLRVLTARQQTTTQQLVRRAMRTAGLLDNRETQ